MTCSGVITNIMESNTDNPQIKASAISGIPSGKLTAADGAVAIKLAGGTVGFSGWLKRSCSTGLTSIKWMAANERSPWGFLGSGYYSTSGITSIITDWSGGTFDVIKTLTLTGQASGGISVGITSATTSSMISWVAMGT